MKEIIYVLIKFDLKSFDPPIFSTFNVYAFNVYVFVF